MSAVYLAGFGLAFAGGSLLVTQPVAAIGILLAGFSLIWSTLK